MKSKISFSKLNLRVTPIREEMITLLMNHQGVALSEPEINQMFNHQPDRVSIYRTIRTLLDKMVIHKVICEDGVLKYALSPKANSEHPHFECTSCGKVLCLNQHGVNSVDVPAGYTAQAIHMLIKGLCPNCVQVFGLNAGGI